MNREDLRKEVLRALARVAPEAEPAAIRGDVAFRDQLDLDSMDFLNFVTALHERLGVAIPEADYPRLATLDAAVAYLLAQSAAAGR